MGEVKEKNIQTQQIANCKPQITNQEITLTINDSIITITKDKSILEAALENAIYIPHLCYHPDLKPVGVCRLCMVEIEGRGLVISCKTPVENGIIVKTESPDINNIRKVAAELLIANHPLTCLSCTKNTQCKLQDTANYLGINDSMLNKLRRTTRVLPLDTSNPFFDRDMNKCIFCGICIRTCAEIQGAYAIDFAYRGYDTMVSAFGDKPLLESNCESCGECLIRCPVGALSPKTFQKPLREIKTICGYCGCGCGIYFGVRGNTLVSARGDKENPASNGHLCVKGRFGYNFINHSDRLTSPLIKQNGEFIKATWDEALDLIASKLSNYKGDQFAAISSAKCTNEENYLIQKFTRAVMETNNIDHCARLCHAPSVSGLAQSFGSGAMTNTIADISDASCVFVIGSNTTETHPIIGLRVRKAVSKGAKLIVVNPKKIPLSKIADVFLQNRPGTDVVLLMGLMRVIVDENLVDNNFIENRCENFAAFKKSLENFDLNFVEQTTGVSKNKISEAARIYAANKPSSILYGMGITQHSHGTDNVLAISNLAMLTGNVGKASSGVNPLRGQNNVQGSCDMGALPNVYSGYQQVANPDIRKKFETAWDCKLSEKPGLTLTEIFGAAIEGKIKAVYLVGENPILSEANATKVEKALQKLEFLAVQDIFLTETASFADVILPATTFAEKDGTFTNTERRVQRLRKVIKPIGDSRADWLITCDIAKKLGAKGFDFKEPSEIMQEITELTPSYRGISYERLENGGLQWPCPDLNHPGTPILHLERFATNNGKSKFIALEYRPSAELPDKEYPLVLTTDRLLYHYHTGTMTRRVEGLNAIRPNEWVEINPVDADSLKLADEEMVRVISKRGTVQCKTKITNDSPQGTVSLTFHFSECPTNIITSPAIDPLAKIPETKVCAVRIERL